MNFSELVLKPEERVVNSSTFLLLFTIYNHFHNILKLFDVLPNLRFTVSEIMRDYYLQTWYIRVTSRVAERLKT